MPAPPPCVLPSPPTPSEKGGLACGVPRGAAARACTCLSVVVCVCTETQRCMRPAVLASACNEDGHNTHSRATPYMHTLPFLQSPRRHLEPPAPGHQLPPAPPLPPDAPSSGPVSGAFVFALSLFAAARKQTTVARQGRGAWASCFHLPFAVTEPQSPSPASLIITQLLIAYE